MAAGKWVCAMGLRRETFGAFQEMWEIIGHGGSAVRPSAALEGEFLDAISLAPFMFFDMKLGVSLTVTVSDASEAGAGACRSTGLSRAGLQLAWAPPFARHHAVEEGVVLLVSLFDSVGGARRSFDLLGVRLVGFVSCECDPRARKVVEATWPEVMSIDDVHKFDSQLARGEIGRAHV